MVYTPPVAPACYSQLPRDCGPLLVHAQVTMLHLPQAANSTCALAAPLPIWQRKHLQTHPRYTYGGLHNGRLWNRQELNLRDRVMLPDRATTLSCSIWALRNCTGHPAGPDELLLTGCSLCMKGVTMSLPCGRWWSCSGSNRDAAGYEPAALPAELQNHIHITYC